MNPSDGSPNRILKLLSNFKFAPVTNGGKLVLYSLGRDEMTKVMPLLEKHRGPLGFLSLRGKKNILLESTGKALPLLHVQFGPCAERSDSQPLTGHQHMFCSPESDDLVSELAKINFAPSSSATLIHHRMRKSDWKFILTSEI